MHMHGLWTIGSDLHAYATLRISTAEFREVFINESQITQSADGDGYTTLYH